MRNHLSDWHFKMQEISLTNISGPDKESIAINELILLKLHMGTTQNNWEHIKRPGPKKSNSLPEAVKTTHGVSHDKVEILNEWKNSFESI